MALKDVVRVEVSTASDPFATAPTFTDISSVVRSVDIDRGRSGAFDLYGVGTCKIELGNNTPTLDPTVWHRWRQVKVTCITTSDVMFRGFIEQVRHDQSRKPFVAFAHVDCVDLFGMISRYEYSSTTGLIPEERSGERISRIVGATGVNIPSAWKSIANGYVTILQPSVTHLVAGNEPFVIAFNVLAHRLVGQDVATNQLVVNALQHCQDCAEAEIGGLYVSAAGVLTFEDRYELLERLEGSPTATFSESPTGSEVGYLFGDMVLVPPGTDYRNRVTFTGASGNPHTFDNVPSNYPADSLSRSLPMSADVEASANAKMLLEIYRQTSSVTWPQHVTVPLHPGFSTNLTAVAALDLRRYCQVKFTPVGKTQQTWKVFVESLKHRISDESWTCTVGFSSADKWVSAWTNKTRYLAFDDATNGKFDTARVGP